MNEHTDSTQPHRTTALVRDRDVAIAVVMDLKARDIPGDRITTRPLNPREGVKGTRETGASDKAFTAAAGKKMGSAWVVGALIGAVVGAIGVSLIIAPPWESPVAAGINLAVALGVAYIAGGMGFLQAGIRKGDASRNAPETAAQDRAQAAANPGAEGVGGSEVELIVDARDAEEVTAVRAVLAAHQVDVTS
jgi:hypothetical protein